MTDQENPNLIALQKELAANIDGHVTWFLVNARRLLRSDSSPWLKQRLESGLRY
jgi:hypothetical protein